MKRFVEDIFGLQGENTATDGKLDGVLQLLIEIRKAAKSIKNAYIKLSKRVFIRPTQLELFT